jgi:hypothetical protein
MIDHWFYSNTNPVSDPPRFGRDTPQSVCMEGVSESEYLKI